MSVRISHPMVAPFVQQAARALYEAGQLDRFVTSIRYAPESMAQKLMFATARIGGFELERDFRRRTVSEIPAGCVESHPWGELLRIAVARLDRDGRATDFVWERTEDAFDRRVARGLHSGLSGVYGFEYSSLAALRRAEALGVPTAYDVPAPEPAFVQGILDRETAKFPELVTPWHHWTAAREDARIARRHAEFRCASVVIAASGFTRRSFSGTDLDVSKVRIVPYGAPPVVSRDRALRGGQQPDQPLQILWAGTFSVRKGAHYLLEAWRRHQLGRHARLRVFGTVALPETALHLLPPGVEFGGAIPHRELLDHFHEADVLMFPTLCDGFGMVATEAWSRGLPVITTAAAGAADLLVNGGNGLLIEPASTEAIANALNWCLEHRAELRAMRGPALDTAAGWQWSDYRAKLAGVLRDAGLFSSRHG